jgi:hypothetical protein
MYELSEPSHVPLLQASDMRASEDGRDARKDPNPAIIAIPLQLSQADGASGPAIGYDVK